LLLRRDSSVGEGSRGLGFGLAKGARKCAVSCKAQEKARKYREMRYSSENAKAGLSNSRVDTEGEGGVLLENILRLLRNATKESEVNGFFFFDAKSY
jgi:hypothetical protein